MEILKYLLVLGHNYPQPYEICYWNTLINYRCDTISALSFIVMWLDVLVFLILMVLGFNCLVSRRYCKYCGNVLIVFLVGFALYAVLNTMLAN